MSSRNSWSYKKVCLFWEGVDVLLKDKYEDARCIGKQTYVQRKRKNQWKSYYNHIVKQKKTARTD